MEVQGGGSGGREKRNESVSGEWEGDEKWWFWDENEGVLRDRMGRRRGGDVEEISGEGGRKAE